MPDSAADDNGPEMAFQSTLDFELQLPVIAVASEPWRRAIDPGSVRHAVHRLFALRENEYQRNELCDAAAGELWEPVRDQVNRQIANSDRMYPVFEERGSETALTEAGVGEIVERIRAWLETELDGWMRTIHERLDERLWLGDQHGSPGVIDVALLADALGLNAYVWNAPVGASPFRRLDMTAATPIGILVLSELYAQAIPVETS
ncbi:hypothetical protein PV458_27020 [Streptomyces sp. MN03-5084-2B]|nr:hypothetical protein [Streptomyces sp. MN03-5084-2B]